MALTSDKHWSKPVYILTGKLGSGKIIDNTRSAYTKLTSAWPTSSGEKFTRALVIFQSVLEHSLPPDHAMAAFLEAAQEADVEVGDVPRYLIRPD